MSKTTRQKVIELFQSQVGYKESGTNLTKYARWFDNEAWQWFNTKKQGAEWCSIFVCWCLCQASVGIGKNEVLKLLGIPSVKNNCAAAVPYLWDYLVKKGYKVSKGSGVPGDIIIFNNKKHVGWIEKADGAKYTTIEGNKSNSVRRCSYSKTSASITGIFHLPLEKYDKVEAPAPEPAKDEVTPAPTPAPAPAPKPTLTPSPAHSVSYIVTAKGGLFLRKSPPSNTNNSSGAYAGTKILCMNYGDTFVETKRSNKWSYGTYKGKTGWACNLYLKKK